MMNSVEIWRQGMMDITVYFVGRFKEDQDGVLSFIAETEVALECLNSTYRYLVNDGSINRIEELEPSVKNKLWEHAKATLPSLSENKAVKLSKAIWLLFSILENEQ